MSKAIDENTNSTIEEAAAVFPEEAGNGITENINSVGTDLDDQPTPKPTLEELCAATLRRRGRRGRPKGSGRKHPENCSPKTFRNFSPLAQLLLITIRLTSPEYME